jgi:hypothetical protein
MASANANISDIAATTIESRSGVLADNLSNSNPLLYELKKNGNTKTFSGGQFIMEEIMYNDPATQNGGSYSGYDMLDITPNSPISSAQYDMKLYNKSAIISGEDRLKNSGNEAIIDLLDARLDIAEKSLMNDLETDLFGDGTGNGGKALTGLAAMVADAPLTGTYGGINRATWAFWRNKAFDATTDFGAAATSLNIQSYMNRAILPTVRGREAPNLGIFDENYYRLFLESLQSIQRISNSDHAEAGFTSLEYLGGGRRMNVVLEGGIGKQISTNRAYFLNTNFMKWRPHADRNFKPIGGKRQSVNQDAEVAIIGWAGNLTSNGPQFHSVLKD